MDPKLRDKLCYQCLPYINQEDIQCNLLPIYEGKQCPCATCLVKVMCTANYYDCKVFSKFSDLQDPLT